MALNAQVLSSYKKIDEAYIDTLLNKEITRNQKKIVVLDDGAAVGIGTHEELFESCEVYREICLSQLSKEEVQ